METTSVAHLTEAKVLITILSDNFKATYSEVDESEHGVKFRRMHLDVEDDGASNSSHHVLESFKCRYSECALSLNTEL